MVKGDVALRIPKQHADGFLLMLSAESHNPRHAKLLGKRTSGKTSDVSNRVPLDQVLIEYQPLIKTFGWVFAHLHTQLPQSFSCIAAMMCAHMLGRGTRQICYKMFFEWQDQVRKIFLETGFVIMSKW